MPSLLQKLSFFDPETGRHFVVADDGFYWKEGKKSPEASKVTKLMKMYGWELTNGNDVWLIFKRRGQRGEVTVTRGSKEWYYDLPGTDEFESAAEGRGLDSLHQALETGQFGGKAKAISASLTVPYPGPERRKDFKRRDEFDRNAMYSVSLSQLHESMAKSVDPAERKEIEQEIARLEEMRTSPKTSGAAATAVNSAGRAHMCDDGWDDLEGKNNLNAQDEFNKEGSILILDGSKKTANGITKTALFVSGVDYEPGNILKLARFRFSPDPVKAISFPRYTADNLAQQIKAFGVTAHAITAKPAGGLLTTQNIKTQKKPPARLLTEQNRKTQKGETKGFLTGVMHMMPSDLAGYGNVCPCASPECRAMCLNTAGMWANAPAVQNSRRMKTELYFKNRPQFMADMRKSIESLVRKAEKQNLTPAVRINGTSDLPQVAMEMAKEFPQVQFYDYTKIPQPWKRQLPNYHITFSRSEINEKDALEALQHGVNVAVVFGVTKGQPLPKEWQGYKVIDGDEHDLRFLDQFEKDDQNKPLVIGLRGKGKARGEHVRSESGFVVDPKKQPLVQIGPAPVPSETLKNKPQVPQPKDEGEELFMEEKEESNPMEKESSSRPHNVWFVEEGFDDMHTRV